MITISVVAAIVWIISMSLIDGPHKKDRCLSTGEYMAGSIHYIGSPPTNIMIKQCGTCRWWDRIYDAQYDISRLPLFVCQGS